MPNETLLGFGRRAARRGDISRVRYVASILTWSSYVSYLSNKLEEHFSLRIGRCDVKSLTEGIV